MGESLQGNQLFRDIDDELSWIREKEQIAASTNRGRDLIGVQNLIKKQHALIAEVNNHEPQIEQVGKAAEEMIQKGHFLAPDIRDKLAQLKDNWRNLKSKAEKRKQGDFFHINVFKIKIFIIFAIYRIGQILLVPFVF